MFKETIQSILDGNSLSEKVAKEVMDQIMEGNATDSQIAGYLIALRMKGEVVDEIVGMVKSMREKSTKVNIENDVFDTCGTGGDALSTFNISTLVSLVLASCGVKVAKHGNRAVSGLCGSADILEQAGVKIDLDPTQVAECINRVGIGFIFAQRYHSAMRFVIGPRKELGVRTVFNILGPLTNPAGAKNQMLGVSDKKLGEILIEVLRRLGSNHVIIVHGMDGLDEVSISTDTWMWELKDGTISNSVISPSELGIQLSSLDKIQVKNSEESYKIFLDVLNGIKGSPQDAVVLNSAVALYAANITESIEGGLSLARTSIEDGKVLQVLESLIDVSNSV